MALDRELLEDTRIELELITEFFKDASLKYFNSRIMTLSLPEPQKMFGFNMYAFSLSGYAPRSIKFNSDYSRVMVVDAEYILSISRIIKNQVDSIGSFIVDIEPGYDELVNKCRKTIDEATAAINQFKERYDMINRRWIQAKADSKSKSSDESNNAPNGKNDTENA